MYIGLEIGKLDCLNHMERVCCEEVRERSLCVGYSGGKLVAIKFLLEVGIVCLILISSSLVVLYLG